GSPHPASFRFHLTMDTLAFGYILPTTGRIRDFHPLETCAARRTESEPLHRIPDVEALFMFAAADKTVPVSLYIHIGSVIMYSVS
ncbi:MAG TPA: hypothetical protein H9715_06625, partial [Candidatus Merdibacter merdigallinarum]|nr:hypothetical protein [Candidatus Merdibacter merdigallinarum]